MAPSRKQKKEDGNGSTQGSGETSDTTQNNGTTSTTQQDDQQFDLTSDSEEEKDVPGAGMERATCPVDGCGWFQRVSPEFPASEANRSAELHMLGAHGLHLGGSMAQFAASVDATLAQLREQSASPRPPPAARMEAAHRPTCKEGMSLTEWRSFLHSWKLYKLSTRLTSDQETVQLWATMSPSVSKSLTNQGLSLDDSGSADELLEHIKTFCCQGHNIIVEQQRFLAITHHAGEKFTK